VDGLPEPAPGRHVVLHTRVVTETGGGPDKTILQSARHAADSKYWLAAAYMHPPDDPGFETVRQRAAEAGAPLIGITDRGALDWRVIREMLKLCRRLDVRIWHAHDYKSNFLGLVLRPLHRMKLITTVHGWGVQFGRTPLYYAIDRRCLRRYDHVICVSDDLYQSVAQLGVRRKRMTHIDNAIDDAVFTRRRPAAQTDLRRELGAPPGRLVVGAMGRLMPEKHFDLLIDCVGELLKEGLDLELWIAGDGQLRGQLQALIAQRNLQERVRLLGFVKDTIAFHESLDVFALSSRREGLPNVVLEAAAMRTAIVSTRVAGIPSMLTHGTNALLCDVEDPRGLTEQLRAVLTDASLRERLAAAARELIGSRYSFRRRMKRMFEIYDRVLGGV